MSDSGDKTTREVLKAEIEGFYPAELETIVTGMGQPKFRSVQVFEWIHKKRVSSFDEMTSLPATFRQQLSEHYRFSVMDPVKVLVSKMDDTRKYVFSLRDKNLIEAVRMKYHHGNSVCVSSQVGCRMGCSFCASTLDGCVRNLSAAEMLSEVYQVEKESGERVSHIVIMGSGEPFDNYDEVIRFIRLATHPQGNDLSVRNITLSTCGIIPGIQRLAREGLPVTLALSLHAPNQELREKMMPIAKVYHYDDLINACRAYFQKTGRRVSFEYAVVKGVNDGREHAEELAEKLKDLHGHVNLIPVNPVRECGYESPDKNSVYAFQQLLTDHGINATIRREMGRDISSACGQLRRGVK